MTYKEQLETTEWIKKRKQILFRDNYRCQLCGKHGICGLNIFIEIKDIKQLKEYIDDKYILELLNTSLYKDIYTDSNKEDFEILVDDEYLLPIKKARQIFYPIITTNSIQIPPQYLFCGDLNDINEVFEYCFQEKNVCIEILGCNRSKEIVPPFFLQIIKIGERDVFQFITKNKSVILRNKTAEIPVLNVHHKSYVINRLAWEYDNSNLITLCENCHEEEHRQREIPLYDEDFNFISNVKTCDKCKGLGYIKKYNHYYNGVCFGCGGTGVVISFLKK